MVKKREPFWWLYKEKKTDGICLLCLILLANSLRVTMAVDVSGEEGKWNPPDWLGKKKKKVGDGKRTLWGIKKLHRESGKVGHVPSLENAVGHKRGRGNAWGQSSKEAHWHLCETLIGRLKSSSPTPPPGSEGRASLHGSSTAGRVLPPSNQGHSLVSNRARVQSSDLPRTGRRKECVETSPLWNFHLSCHLG